MSLKSMFNTQVKIRRYNSPTLDSSGGNIITKTGDIVVKGNLRLLSADERTVTGRDGVVSTHRLYLPMGTDIAFKDVARINEEEYSVNFVDNPHGKNKFLQVELTIRR